MVDKSKDTKILNTLHSTVAGSNKLAHADEVYLDGYDENTASGEVTSKDNVESAIKKLEGKYQSYLPLAGGQMTDGANIKINSTSLLHTPLSFTEGDTKSTGAVFQVSGTSYGYNLNIYDYRNGSIAQQTEMSGGKLQYKNIADNAIVDISPYWVKASVNDTDYANIQWDGISVQKQETIGPTDETSISSTGITANGVAVTGKSGSTPTSGDIGDVDVHIYANRISINQDSLQIGAMADGFFGIRQQDKTSEDIFNAAGRTTKLKMVFGNSLFTDNADDDISIPVATASADGLLSKEDKAKLDAIEARLTACETELAGAQAAADELLNASL